MADEGEPRLQGRHWQHWVHSTDHIFRFTTHEQTLTACNDEQRAWKLTPDGRSVYSRLIVAQFWSELPAAAFRDVCSAEVLAGVLHVLEIGNSLPPDDGHEVPTADGYDWDFEETVSIITES